MVWLKVNSVSCKYPIVKDCLVNARLRDTEGDDWHLIWIDTATSLDRVLLLKVHLHAFYNQRQGMIAICRKDFLARNVARAQKILPSHYTFFPQTWVLPQDLTTLSTYIKTRRRSTFISKPDNGCQGKDIFLFNTLSDFTAHKTSHKTKFLDSHLRHDCVVQEYVDDPMLLDGFKFDLRIYVLVKSMDPLVVYVYEEGLVRLATIPYATPNLKNLKEHCMHLTNYAITKESDRFVVDDSGTSGSKRTLTSFWQTFQAQPAKLWRDIQEVIVKTLLLVQPDIGHVMRGIENPLGLESKCFEVLGFDVMVDSRLRPIVLEVNHSPSFACESELDLRVKTALIADTLALLDADFCKLGQTKRSVPASSKNLYTQIYPSEDIDQQKMYEECLAKIQELASNQSNKAETERRRWIKTKLENIEKTKEDVRIWKERHSEKTKALVLVHESRPAVDKKRSEVVRVDKSVMGKVAMKISITDLCIEF